MLHQRCIVAQALRRGGIGPPTGSTTTRMAAQDSMLSPGSMAGVRPRRLVDLSGLLAPDGGGGTAQV
jgi:hypothetical protein